MANSENSPALHAKKNSKTEYSKVVVVLDSEQLFYSVVK